MKVLLMALTYLLILSSGGCSQQRRYVYPTDERLELQRVCRAVSSRNTNRFMVLLGKIYPLNNDGKTAELEEIRTELKDAGYFAGIIDCKMRPVQLQTNIELNPKIVLFPDKTMKSLIF